MLCVGRAVVKKSKLPAAHAGTLEGAGDDVKSLLSALAATSLDPLTKPVAARGVVGRCVPVSEAEKQRGNLKRRVVSIPAAAAGKNDESSASTGVAAAVPGFGRTPQRPSRDGAQASYHEALASCSSSVPRKNVSSVAPVSRGPPADASKLSLSSAVSHDPPSGAPRRHGDRRHGPSSN